MATAFNPASPPMAEEPRHAQQALIGTDHVASVTQLGIRLRVLVPHSVPEPVGIVTAVLAQADIPATTRTAEPSLEDVFVASTLATEGAD